MNANRSYYLIKLDYTQGHITKPVIVICVHFKDLLFVHFRNHETHLNDIRIKTYLLWGFMVAI